MNKNDNPFSFTDLADNLDFSNKVILVAEDDPNSSFILDKTLIRAGYKNVHLVNSGDLALEFIKTHPVDIYITDIGMPGHFDGIESAQIASTQYKIPIIFVTGFSDRATITRARELKPAAYLLKPFKQDDVSIAVEMALHKTEIQKTLEKTEQNNRLLATALASIQDAVAITDAQDDSLKVIHVNDAFTRLVECSTEQCIGKPIAELCHVFREPDDNANLNPKESADYHSQESTGQQTIKNPFLTPSFFVSEQVEQVLVRRNNETLVAQISISPIENRNQTVEHLVYVIRDITEIKQAEERQYQSQRIESLGRFTGGIAHDFNNILAVINAYSDLLKLKIGIDDPHIKYVENIRAAGQRGTDLVAQLMTFARSRPSLPTLIDLNELTQATFTMLRRLIPSPISIEINSEENLPKICASISQIEQVLINLCVNARDAIGDTGKICIRIDTQPFPLTLEKQCRPHASYVWLHVSDTGCGMSKKVANKIFEPFFTTKDIGKGTGLGLSTVYGIVKQYEGIIEVESELGKGTTFHIAFKSMPSDSE